MHLRLHRIGIVIGIILLAAGMYLAVLWYRTPDGITNIGLLVLFLLPGLLQTAFSVLKVTAKNRKLVFWHIILLALAVLIALGLWAGASMRRHIAPTSDPRRYHELLADRYAGSGTAHFPTQIPKEATDVRLYATLFLPEPALQLALHISKSYLVSELRRYRPKASEILKGGDEVSYIWWAVHREKGPGYRLPSDYEVLILPNESKYQWPVRGIAVSLKRGEIIYFYQSD